MFLLIGGFLATLLVQRSLPCANSISCIKNLSSTVENDASGTFLGQTVAAPSIDLGNETYRSNVLGDTSTQAEKHIYVDLATQTLYAYEGRELFMQTLVSTGKWGRTPPGEYRIWIKVRSTRMTGGSGNDYYNLPNVPYVMFFFNDHVSKARGYSLHGAYWHNNFGHEMSHGCVNMRPIDAEKIYDWASPSTKGNTTYESSEDPGTSITICQQLTFPQGGLPTCLE